MSVDRTVHFRAEGPGPRARARGEWKAGCGRQEASKGSLRAHRMEGRAGTPDFLPQVTALSSRWQSQAATGGRGQKAVDPGLARSGAGWALGQDYRQWSWERVRGEMWRGSSPFCHEHAVVHSHVCHQVEWPRLPKAVHLSLIPSSHTFATITPMPWGSAQKLQVPTCWVSAGAPCSCPQGVITTCHRGLCPRHCAPPAALWQGKEAHRGSPA